jgi:hypothetical protein
MPLTSLTTLESAIRAAWSAQTADPVDADRWTPENPAFGQCAVTAHVIHDQLGGEVLHARVTRRDGSDGGHHYWNRLRGGLELDLTLEQFRDGERLGPPDVVATLPAPGQGRLAVQTARLREAVSRRLAGEAPPGPG